MTLFIAAVALLVALWLSSLAATFAINRMWPPHGRLLRVDGFHVHVLSLPASRPGAPTLLLIHGASGNLREPIAALQDALGGRFNLIAVDRPGHGHTTPGHRAASDPEVQADLVGAVLDRLGVESCLVLGHSWGAAVAAALALRRPERVDGLILLAPATHPWKGGISRRTRLFAHPLAGSILAELVLLPIGLLLIYPTIGRIFAPDPVPPGFARRMGALLAVRPRPFAASCRDIADLNGHLLRLSARYGEISVPTEIVSGDEDRVVAHRLHACGLARDIPSARLTVLAGTGHMPHWSNTAAVVAAIERVAAASHRLAVPKPRESSRASAAVH